MREFKVRPVLEAARNEGRARVPRCQEWGCNRKATRCYVCECDADTCAFDSSHRCPKWDNVRGRCESEAVRMVTVQSRVSAGQMIGLAPYPDAQSIPMCEPCAAWHEAKASARS